MPEISQLKRILEAALLASAQPLTVPQMSALFDEFEMPPHEDIARAVEELQRDSTERGIELIEVASGFRYQIRQEVHPFVARLWSERQTRYSRALLETLSLIAYRQPITRAEIEQIRGVAVSTNMIRTLEEREWVRVVGYRDLPGKPALFGTTKQFLDYFALTSLDQLPALSEIRDIEEFDQQLALDAVAPGIPAHMLVALEADETEEVSAAADTLADDAAPPFEPAARSDAAEPVDASDAAQDADAPPSSAEPTPGAPPDSETETLA